MSDGFKFPDRYERVARFYPAAIAAVPLLLTTVSLKPDLFAANTSRVFGSAAVACGLIALFMNVARQYGKATERALLESWGGWPTTLFLRHRNPAIDPHTKARYHAELQKLCPDLTMPTRVLEGATPAVADDVYRSATRRLLELRREPKYRLLHQENAQYGFRRNLLGLKPIALSILALSLAIGGAVVGAAPPGRGALFSDLSNRWTIYAASLANLVTFLVWVVVITPRFVRSAADDYALALLRTLED